jgi:hypothetical protein
MSSVNDFLRDALDGARKAANNRVDDSFADGFDKAANICTGVLSKNIDGLKKKMEAGDYLSSQEQFLLSRLFEIESETEKDLRDNWGSVAAGEGRP